MDLDYYELGIIKSLYAFEHNLRFSFLSKEDFRKECVRIYKTVGRSTQIVEHQI